MLGRVEAVGLVKEFRTFKRKEGLWGAVRDLFSREYVTLRAVDSISFKIEPGEMVGCIGPNGAGKSTSVKMLSGILVPTEGSVVANGFVPYRDRMAYTRTIGAVFGQRTQLWWDIAVVESFRLLKQIYEVSDADYKTRMARFDEILEINRYLHQPVRKLSLGERMRCDMAAALLHNPPLLFLDEPTIGLDVTMQRRIREFIAEYNRSTGATVLLTSHYMLDVEALCKRVIIIHRGRILFDGKLADLVARFSPHKTIVVELETEGTDLTSYGDVVEAEGNRYSLRVPKSETPKITAQLLGDLPVIDLTVKDPPIEEVIEQAFSGSLEPES